jgi:hypothetical protein
VARKSGKWDGYTIEREKGLKKEIKPTSTLPPARSGELRRRRRGTSRETARAGRVRAGTDRKGRSDGRDEGRFCGEKKKESVRSQDGNIKDGTRMESKHENIEVIWTSTPPRVLIHRTPTLLLPSE